MKKLFVKKINSRGAVSVFLVMSILASIMVIALGTSFSVSTEAKLSASSSESIVSYYQAESGLEQALYDKVKQNRVPRVNRCGSNCPGGSAGVVCAASGGWTCTQNELGPSVPYCIEVKIKVAGDPCNNNDITAIKSIGENKSTRRSIEIVF